MRNRRIAILKMRRDRGIGTFYRREDRALRYVNRVPFLQRLTRETVFFLGWLMGVCTGALVTLMVVW